MPESMMRTRAVNNADVIMFSWSLQSNGFYSLVLSAADEVGSKGPGGFNPKKAKKSQLEQIYCA